ncbi:hypothetical protein BJV74DRAFT_367461 [Russula compacta]|nr:hypothetical protein BJV74DRAFT_367461 [Russula compacta]
MASSSNKKDKNISSPLAPLAPLHALAQLVPAAPSGTRSRSSASASKPEREFAFIMLTSLKSDAWLVHVGHPDGRWWNGAWRVADVEKLADGDMSSARLGAFAQRVARAIAQGEVAVAHEGDNFRNMKLMLGTHAKKPLCLALSELDKENAARFAFEYFARVAESAQPHGCRILRGDAGDTSADVDPIPKGISHPPLKRRRDSPASERSVSPMSISQNSHKIRSTGPLRDDADDDDDDDDDNADSIGTSRASTQRVHAKFTGKRKPPPPQATQARAKAQTTAERTALAEVQELRAELVKARADAAAAAVALAAEREPHGLGGSTDRLRSRAAVPAMPRRPGASLANPNKAARRVTAVEFASDSDDA